MQIRLESTTKIVELKTESGTVPARIWEGHTANGIAVHAYITRVAVRDDQDCSQFEQELQEHKPPSPEVAAIPLSLIL